MKNIILILVVSVMCLCSRAQSTGYLGTRVHAGYGFNFSPALFGSNYKNETIIGLSGSATSGKLAFNSIHEGFLEVAPSGKMEIGISLRYFKTAYDNSRPFYDPFNGLTSQFNYVEDQPSGYYTIKGSTYTVYMRYFGSRYIAPWGRYFMFGPVFNITKTQYDPSIMSIRAYRNSYLGYGNGDTLITDFGSQDQKRVGINIMFGAGRSRVIANRITLDYGFNTHLLSLFYGLFDTVESDFFTRTETLDNTNYIKRTSRMRVRGVNRFNVFVKVGVLLF